MRVIAVFVVAIVTLSGAAFVIVDLTANPASADQTTQGNDNMRTSWYSDQTQLSPQSVTSGSFGQLMSAAVNGAVLAQPLVADNTLLVETENDYAYGMDPRSGAQRWSDNFGPSYVIGNDPHNASCTDIVPTIGTTATPVVDPSTNTEYFTTQTMVSGVPQYFLHALAVATGIEQPNFPVLIAGTADNDSTHTFVAEHQLQRPGLLLMNGVIYIGFGAHCWLAPEEGWIFGISTAGKTVARWSDEAGVPQTNQLGPGGGIWMSGAGLMSDGPGQIVIATGTGVTPSTAAPGSQAPGSLAQSIVRLTVQSDGTLKPTDFFTPYDGNALNSTDSDIGSGGIVELPPQYFGTTAHPELFMQIGKQGQLYLLDGKNLGGFDQGPSASDNVVYKAQNFGVWGKPAVWPGDGGWVYLTTASGGKGAGQLEALQYGLDANGSPTLSQLGESTDQFGYGSSSASVSSNGTTSGSALVWVVWIPADSASSGNGAQLRAYLPVPVNGQMQMVWSAPIGAGTKFAPPAISGNTVYVGTRDGHVLAFGSPVPSPLTAGGITFPTTVVGSQATGSETFTVNTQLTVSKISVTGAFTAGASTPALNTSMAPATQLTIPLTFSPTSPGSTGGSLQLTTSEGVETYPLSGTGESPGPDLSVYPQNISFGGVQVGQSATQSVILTNEGAQTLTINSNSLPGGPYSIAGLPAVGSSISSGQSVTATLTYAPTQVGQDDGQLQISSTGGTSTVSIDGTGGTPPQMVISNENIEYGTVPIGVTATETFLVQNTGGTPLIIEKSKPPIASNGFTASTSLGEGIALQPGQSTIERVNFTPTATGDQKATWIIQGSDTSGQQTVNFDGTGGSAPAPTISPGDVDVVVPTTGTTTANFPVTLSAPSASTVTVNYKTLDGSATAASGAYVATSGTVTFAPGQTTMSVPVTINGAVLSATTTMSLNFSASSGALLAYPYGRAYLANIILPGSLVAYDTTASPPAAGSSSTLTFPVTMTGLPTGRTATVSVATADGTAIAANGDYTPVSTTLTFTGNSTQNVAVSVLHAPPTGTNSTVLLNLTNGSSTVKVADAQAVGTVVGGTAPLPALYLADTAVARPQTGTVTTTFTATLSPASTQTVQAIAQTATNSTLVAGVDYTSLSGDSLTFAPGQTTQTFSVTVNGSSTSSGVGTISASLAKPVNATLASAGAKSYVVSPVRHGFLAPAPLTAWVSPGEVTKAPVVVSLQSPVNVATTVTVATADGTAKAGTDYTAISQQVTIPAGGLQATVYVPVLANATLSTSKQFTINLSAVSSGGVIVIPSAIVTLAPPSPGTSVPAALVAPKFTAASPPTTGSGGTAYSYTFTATGYPAPTFNVVEGGQVPPGLTLDPTGLLAGTPTDNGVYTFSVAASNGVNPAAATGTLTITVTGAGDEASFTADSPPSSANVGVSYTYTFTATGNPTPTFQLSAGQLPPGLTLNATTGVLSGSPTLAGVYNFQLEADNGVSEPDVTSTLTITVTSSTNSPVITAQSPPSAATVGQSYQYQFTASGSPAPTWTVSSGSLPAGLNLASSSGLLSGTPTTVATSTFSVTAANGIAPAAMSNSLTISVSPAPAAPVFTADTPPATATTGTTYSYQFVASGSPAPTFSVQTGQMPAGVALDPVSGTLSGTPNTVGTFNFTVLASNGVGAGAASPTLTITVGSPATSTDVQVLLTGPASVTRGTAGTYGVAAKNLGSIAATNVTLSLVLPAGAVVGTLPAGVALSNGVLSETVATIAAGKNTKFQVSVTLSQTGTFTATVSASTTDPNSANNTATLSTTVKG